MDTSRLTPCAVMQGEDEKETSLLRAMLVEARDYIQSFRWCPPISEEYLGFGIEKVFATFLFRFAKPIGETDDCLWVVVGDVPSAYLVTDNAPNPGSAADLYCEMMDDWVRAVLNKEPLTEVFPVKADATSEMAEKLKSRLQFIRSELLPMM